MLETGSLGFDVSGCTNLSATSDVIIRQMILGRAGTLAILLNDGSVKVYKSPPFPSDIMDGEPQCLAGTATAITWLLGTPWKLGDQLAVGQQDGFVQIYSTKQTGFIKTSTIAPSNNQSAVAALASSPHSPLLLVCHANGSVRQVDVHRDVVRALLRGPIAAAIYLKGTSDAVILASDQKVTILLKNGNMKSIPLPVEANAECLCQKAYNTFFVGCEDQLLVMNLSGIESTVASCVSRIKSVSYLHDDMYVVGGSKGEIEIWDGHISLQKMNLPINNVYSLCALETSKEFLASGDFDSCVWCLAWHSARFMSPDQLEHVKNRMKEFNGEECTDVMQRHVKTYLQESPGAVDGERVVLTENGTDVAVFEWSEPCNIWFQRLPKMQKKTGEWYNFVFEVQKPPPSCMMVEIGVNLEDDPHNVAEESVTRHSLRPNYSAQDLEEYMSKYLIKPVSDHPALHVRETGAEGGQGGEDEGTSEEAHIRGAVLEEALGDSCTVETLGHRLRGRFPNVSLEHLLHIIGELLVWDGEVWQER